jgi:hypothetical protein
MKTIGLGLYVTGIAWTLVSPSVNGLIMWFTGLVIFFWADIGNQREQARIVQESQ